MRRPISSVFVIKLILQITGEVTSNNAGTDRDMQRLLTDLTSYPKEIRPMRNYSETLTIAISLKLHDIIDFRDRILTARITVEQIWNNYWMRWKPDAYGGIKHSALPANEIWHPDIALYNSAEDNHYFHGPTIKVYYTGYQEWKSTQTVRVLCPEPLDSGIEKRCLLKLGSWTYDGNMLDIQHKLGRFVNVIGVTKNANITGSRGQSWKIVPGLDLSEYRSSPRWNITGTEAFNNIKYYTCCEEPYHDLAFHLTLTRIGELYKSPEILIWSLLTFLPMLTFLVPVESNQKVSLAAINFLLVVVTVAVTSYSQSESRLFLLNKFCCFVFLLDLLAIISAVSVVWAHSRNSQMSKLLRNIIPTLSKLTFVGNPNTTQTPDGKRVEHLNSFENSTPGLQVISKHLNEEAAIESIKYDWVCLSSVINRLCFCLFSIVVASGLIWFF